MGSLQSGRKLEAVGGYDPVVMVSGSNQSGRIVSSYAQIVQGGIGV